MRFLRPMAAGEIFCLLWSHMIFHLSHDAIILARLVVSGRCTHAASSRGHGEMPNYRKSSPKRLSILQDPAKNCRITNKYGNLAPAWWLPPLQSQKFQGPAGRAWEALKWFAVACQLITIHSESGRRTIPTRKETLWTIWTIHKCLSIVVQGQVTKKETILKAFLIQYDSSWRLESLDLALSMSSPRRLAKCLERCGSNRWNLSLGFWKEGWTWTMSHLAVLDPEIKVWTAYFPYQIWNPQKFKRLAIG